MRPLGLIFKNHLCLIVVSRTASELRMPRVFVLLLLNVGSNIDRLNLVGQTKLLQGDGGLDAVCSGPGVEGDVRGHGEVGADFG